MQSEKEKKERKKRNMTDSYGKPANPTPTLLWPSTAIRFQIINKRKHRASTILPSKSTCQSLFGRKNCLYLAAVLLKPESSQDALVQRSVILETVTQRTQAQLLSG